MREPDGFRDFVVLRSSALVRFGWLLTGDWDAAEDLVQTALVKAWGRWNAIWHDDQTGYVRRVMVNSHVSQARRRRVQEVLRGNLPEPVQGEPMSDVDSRLVLFGALKQLPPRQRAILALRYYEDLSESEVARVMNCATGTVKSQSAKALVKLRASAVLRDLVSEERIP